MASRRDWHYTVIRAALARGARGIAQTQNVAPDEEKEVTSELRIKELEQSYLSRAAGGDPQGIEAIKRYFEWMNDQIRWTETARRDAEPSHLDALLRLAARFARRPSRRSVQCIQVG
jgi:hypothetical protein